MHTNRTEVHEGGEGNDPEVLGVDYVAVIELGEAMLDNWVRVCGVKQRANHKAVS